MSFRRRITLVSAAAVAIAVVLASLLTYLLTSHELRGQVDSQLSSRADSLRFVASGPARRSRSALLDLIKGQDSEQAPSTRTPRGVTPLGNLPPRPGQVRGYQQLVDEHGHVLFRSSGNVTLPVDARIRELARSTGGRYFRDARVNGLDLRILAEHIAPGRAVQVAQQLTEVDRLLRHLRLILALLDIGGIALAALLGRLVAGAAVLPVKRLTQATEHVTRTQDLSQRIAPVGEDEIGRLATSFNAMLDALERSMSALDASVHAQRQLVADASHELRTPVTSLRTNIEILQQAHDMDPDERQRLLADVVEQIGELTLLMNDLIDLARGEEPRADTEDTRLDLMVSEVAERTRRRAPATPFLLNLAPTILPGVPARLERAVANLLDNAVKYSPPDEPVEIELHGQELTVRDHGPGISAEDLAHVFDRFYRGAEARGRPGSGLGLAIVRQVVRQHGGSVTAERAPGGGTLMRLRLPGAEPVEEDPYDAYPQSAGARRPISDRSTV
ncbi:MAG TPA: HAMP domain-containing sensor histidine kinase [Solirubrobacteraceae bacterium]|nr:HAMP domain-containing sensor histidine kinase [Solirubrobacteraceae bacterium]